MVQHFSNWPSHSSTVRTLRQEATSISRKTWSIRTFTCMYFLGFKYHLPEVTKIIKDTHTCTRALFLSVGRYFQIMLLVIVVLKVRKNVIFVCLSFLDLNLKILRDDSACPGACQVIKWFDLFFIQYLCNPFSVFSCRVKGCFDALDRKYVR